VEFTVLSCSVLFFTTHPGLSNVGCLIVHVHCPIQNHVWTCFQELLEKTITDTGNSTPPLLISCLYCMMNDATNLLKEAFEVYFS